MATLTVPVTCPGRGWGAWGQKGGAGQCPLPTVHWGTRPTDALRGEVHPPHPEPLPPERTLWLRRASGRSRLGLTARVGVPPPSPPPPSAPRERPALSPGPSGPDAPGLRADLQPLPRGRPLRLPPGAPAGPPVPGRGPAGHPPLPEVPAGRRHVPAAGYAAGRGDGAGRAGGRRAVPRRHGPPQPGEGCGPRMVPAG